ncbi:MAG: cupredoxin domain-containing protein [Euzebya sp.]
MSFSRLFALLVLVVVVLVPTAAFAADVTVTGDGVEPNPVQVDIGEPVVFNNAGEDQVRLIDDAGRWDSGDLAPGETFRITFDVAGTFPFTSQDGAITGAIEVGGGTPATDTPATDTPASEAPPSPMPTETGPPSDLAATGIPAAPLALAVVLALFAGTVLLRRTGRP